MYIINQWKNSQNYILLSLNVNFTFRSRGCHKIRKKIVTLVSSLFKIELFHLILLITIYLSRFVIETQTILTLEWATMFANIARNFPGNLCHGANVFQRHKFFLSCYGTTARVINDLAHLFLLLYLAIISHISAHCVSFNLFIYLFTNQSLWELVRYRETQNDRWRF